MAFTIDDLIDGVRASRKHFLKHLENLREDQWDWKPYEECQSIRGTLAHLLGDDRAALHTLQTGTDPDWEAIYAEPERDSVKLRAMLDASHAHLLDFIKTRYSDAPLDTEVHLWGGKEKLGRAVAHLSSEDFYHSGQVAFIRMATDPSWDYYAEIYG